MKVIDPGHTYELISLDGGKSETLRFVKRKYPLDMRLQVHPGTTCQDVLRTIHNRIEHLHAEKPHWVNAWIRLFVRLAIWLFEFRAARLRSHSYWHSPWFATHAPMCPTCGHTDCRKNHGSNDV